MKGVSITHTILLLSYTFCIGQEAHEREFRIQPSDVPVDALSFMTSINFQGKVKWFEEHGEDGITYEAKTKHHNTGYSIEFHESGSLKDVEYTLDPKTLPATQLNSIHALFSRYRILKFQIQVEGEAKDMWELIRNNPGSIPDGALYEVLVNGKKDGKRKTFELLIDANGEVVEIEPVKLRNTAHLDF